jgi:LPXTG-site transpeptidase (sortase) family protein
MALVGVALGVMAVQQTGGATPADVSPAGQAATAQVHPPYRTAAPVTLAAKSSSETARRPGRSTGGIPSGVTIPRLDVETPVVGITAPDRTLTPPSDPQTLGWWSDGARPGAARGSALVTGHTVHTGGGALDDLEHLRVGDRVVVRTSAGTVRYAVRAVSVYRKASLARDAEELFSQDVAGRLVLVTCEDWNGSVYLSNVVVVAEPVPDPD